MTQLSVTERDVAAQSADPAAPEPASTREVATSCEADSSVRASSASPAPRIHETAFIAHNATVIGNVEIGEQSCVLFNATLRGDCKGRIVVGARTNIQELACVHVPLGGETRIGSDVTIGHGAIIHGCIIGDGTLVGMGAIVIDGARIGKHCLVGAGALVTGKADIPDGMLVVGSPARAVRPLTTEEVESLAVNVNEYVEIARDLARQGLGA